MAFDTIENILKCGDEHFTDDSGVNQFVIQMEVDGVFDKMVEAQMHKNHRVCEKASKILNKYFVTEDEDLLAAIQGNSSGAAF